MGRGEARSIPPLVMLSGLFTASIVVANIAAGVKLERVLGMVVPAGTISYCITFPITDIVDEVWGKREALYIVWAGLGAEVLMLAMIMADWIIPPISPETQVFYEKVFHLQPRIVAASIAAYVVSQHHDVWAFMKWREITRGRFLWVRNNASTIVSQLIDSSIFTTVAFYGQVPLYTLVNMILSLWSFKVLVALCDTPFVYLGVHVVRRFLKGS